ncbi:MAG: glycosyltransferase [Fibrobacteria bacterium]|nr:glycosyltransferase [Fibrobacteria bacterium]
MQIIPPEKLLIVTRKWHFRGSHTSVERFLDFFSGSPVISNENEFKRPYRFIKALAKKANHSAYTRQSAGLEIAALLYAIWHRPALVHFFYGDHDYHFAGKVLRLFGIKCAATFYFSIKELEERMDNKNHFQYLDLALATGRAQQEYLSSFINPDNLDYLPLGVDTHFFTPLSGFIPDPENPIILQVGVNRRDFKLAHQTLSQLKKDYQKLVVHMIGCYDQKESFSDLPFVQFHQKISDDELLHLYQSATLLLLPLEDGGSSNTLNEALACGLPVVATKVINFVDYTNDDCVSLCPQGNAAVMVDSCKSIISNTKNYETFRIAARNLACSYSWENIYTQLTGIYQKRLNLRIKTI